MTTFDYKQSPNSRYLHTPATIVDGKIQYELWKSNPEFRGTSDYRTHVVRNTDIGRLDLLAYEYYGTPSLWWVIADANDIINQFDLTLGQALKIPSRALIERYLHAAPRA